MNKRSKPKKNGSLKNNRYFWQNQRRQRLWEMLGSDSRRKKNMLKKRCRCLNKGVKRDSKSQEGWLKWKLKRWLKFFHRTSNLNKWGNKLFWTSKLKLRSDMWIRNMRNRGRLRNVRLKIWKRKSIDAEYSHKMWKSCKERRCVTKISATKKKRIYE
jgi:hypothetical protein